MHDEKSVKTELAILLLTPSGPAESQVTHREGRIRGLVFALTGNDIGYRCGYRDRVKQICEWLNWSYKDCGESGWEIDSTYTQSV